MGTSRKTESGGCPSHLPDRWQEARFADFCEITRGGSPRPIHDYIVPSGTPWVKIADATDTNSRYIFKTKEFIKPEGESKSRVVYPGDFIVSNSATPGLPRFMKIRACIHDGWLLLREIKNASKLFLYYLILKEREAILMLGSGTIFTNLKTEILKNYIVSLPPLPEQKAIAEVLSSLDDKIDLLHRQNKTLEDTAQTIFRQWFVEEADEDWEENGLLDIIEIVGGGTPKTTISEYWGGDIPWLSGGDIASNHKTFANATAKTISLDGLKNSSAKLLPQYATVISARGTVGKYCLLSRSMAFSQSNYGVLPRYKKCFFFTYLLLNHIVEELNSAAYGSVFNTITTVTFKDINFALPQRDSVENFEIRITPHFKKILANKHQIHTLESLRDTLLPKLTNGTVRVRITPTTREQT